MQDLQTRFQAGHDVTVRDQPWRVIAAEAFGPVTLLTLRGIGSHNRGERRRVLAPFDEATPRTAATRVRQRRRRAVLAAAAVAAADAAEWGDCWTAASAVIDLRPWQLEPAIAAVAGATRILLADEVGLGKTIQASLIVSELFARGLASRALVLAPAALRHQWASEMSSRFRLAPVVFDHAAIVALDAAIPIGVNPWKTAPLMISSIDLVKRPEVRAALGSVPIDVLVVDEAHHLTPGSDRGAVVADLAQRTPWIVLATATPHSGDDGGYKFLLSLGDVGTESMTVYRRSAKHVRTAPPRRSKLLGIRATVEERAMLTATMDYARALWRAGVTRPGAALVASVIARRAASSAAAARQTLQRRLRLLEGDAAQEAQPVLPWEDGDGEDGPLGDALLATPGLADPGSEIKALRQLVELSGAAEGKSSKLAAIRRLLRRCQEPILVFSEYRDVVDLVAGTLAEVVSVAVLHGGLTTRERQDAVRAFTDGGAQALVATDAAGEGLNLHNRCRIVVNLELPWNPQRLEQRIGRVDRLGQTRRVHALHLVHQNSFEARVVARLTQRYRDAKLPLSVPSSQLETWAAGERRLLALAARAQGSSTSPLPTHLAAAERSAAAVYATRSHPGRRLYMLFTTALVDGSGRHVRRHVSVLCAPTSLHALTRRMVRSLLKRADVVEVLDLDVARAVAGASVRCGETATALERRCRVIADLLTASQRTTGYQGSLFDRRAEQQARGLRDALLDLQAHVERRLGDAAALRTLSAGAPQLVAAWLGE